MNNKVRKFFAILLIVLLLLISSANYYGIKGIDNLAYVVAIGLDVGKNDALNLSLQISMPTTSEGGSSSSQSSSVVVDSIECSSITSGISLFNSFLGKEVTLSHCKVLVISEELAEKGVSEYLYTLSNNIEFRTDSNIIISKCDARTFLEYSTPLLDKISARYYDIAPSSSEYTGYTESITCNEFLTAINDKYSEPSAILGSINISTTQKPSNNSSYAAGETPISGDEPSVETMGLAVFNSDKLVGELNGLESICHLIISNKLKNAQIRIPSPIDGLDYIDLYIELEKNTKNSVLLVNGSPYITSNICINGKMQSMNDNIELNDENVIAQIEQYAKSYVEQNMYNYLYKTSKELHADIDSFGLYALKYFYNTSEWGQYNWPARYKDASFEINVDFNLRSSYLLVST